MKMIEVCNSIISDDDEIKMNAKFVADDIFSRNEESGGQMS